MPIQNEERRRAFERHVRRADRAERLKTAAPFAAIAAVILCLVGGMSWFNFSSVPCGVIEGVVQTARSERTFGGERHFLTVKGDDTNNYYSEDPGDRAHPEGARVALDKSCSRTGAPRPMAHFDHWLSDGDAAGNG